MPEPRIIVARITALPRPLPEGMGDPLPEVWATFDGEAEERFLLHYYPDEIAFTPDELVGLTEAQVRHLHFEKDRAYLQADDVSPGHYRPVWNQRWGRNT